MNNFFCKTASRLSKQISQTGEFYVETLEVNIGNT